MIHLHSAPAVGPRASAGSCILPCTSIDSVLTRRA